MSEALPRNILLRCGGRTLQRYNVLAVAGAARGRAVPVPYTFARADGATPLATLIDRDQKMQLAAADKVRIEYPPALSGLVDQFGYPYCGPSLEGSRTNLIENANYEVDAVGSAANAATIARDATNVRLGSWALKVTTTNVGDSGVVWRKRDATKILATAGTIYGQSAWVYAPAASVGKTLQFAIIWFTAADAIISTVRSTAVALVAGWQRLVFNGTVAAPGTTAKAEPYLLTDVAQGVFDFWVDVPQLEVGFASSAIPTGTVAVTRAADTFIRTINFGTMALTVYGEIIAPYPITFLPTVEQGVFTLGDGWGAATDDACFLDWTAGGTLNLYHGSNNGVAQSSASPATLTYPLKYAAQLYSDGAVQLHLKGGNGVAVSATKSAARPFVSSTFRSSTHQLGTREGGGLPGFYTHLDHKIHRGVFSLAECEAVP